VNDSQLAVLLDFLQAVHVVETSAQHQMTPTVPRFKFVPVDPPKVNQIVVVLRDRRRHQILDKDLVDESIDALSRRYTKGSLYQDLQTKERAAAQARATVVNAWSMVSAPPLEDSVPV